MTPSPGAGVAAPEFLPELPARGHAGRVGMSLRNFVRRFKQATGDSPLAYLQKLRIASAKRLLESDHRTMQEMCDAVGYQDVAFFRALFPATHGSLPRRLSAEVRG